MIKIRACQGFLHMLRALRMTALVLHPQDGKEVVAATLISQDATSKIVSLFFFFFFYSCTYQYEAQSTHFHMKETIKFDSKNYFIFRNDSRNF
jgi:hypothetical protein